MRRIETDSTVGQQRLAEALVHYPELEGSLGRGDIGADAWIDAEDRRVLLEAGQRASRFPLVVRGQVRIWFPTLDGTELFLCTLRPGDLCAMTAMAMLGGERCRVRAIAEPRTSGIGLHGDAFRDLFRNQESFRRRVFVSLSRNANAMLTMLEEVTRFDVSTRLSRRLLADAPVIATTHQELADGMGCSRERVSKLLERFQRSGWVQLSRGVIRVLDTGALRRVASHQRQSPPGTV